MTVLTRPAIADGVTLPRSKAAFGEPDINFKFAVDDLLQSSLTANAQDGFNWNFTTDQLHSLLQAGTANLTNDFTDIPPNTPGLYNLDVCVVTEMSYVSDARQYLLSNHKGPSLIYPYIHLDPCACSTFSSQGQKFTDYAQPNVTGTVTTDYMNVTCESRGMEANGGD